MPRTLGAAGAYSAGRQSLLSTSWDLRDSEPVLVQWFRLLNDDGLVTDGASVGRNPRWVKVPARNAPVWSRRSPRPL
jgi:hypothetical protein